MSTITGMMQSIKELGLLLEKEHQANQLVDTFTEFIKSYHQEVIEKEGPTVLILVGTQDGYQVSSENSYIGNLVKLSGGMNVFGDAYSDELLLVTEEEIAQSDPMIILRIPGSFTDEGIFEKEFSTNGMWKNLDAVANGSVYDLEYETIGTITNLEYQDTMHVLKHIFYPE